MSVQLDKPDSEKPLQSIEDNLDETLEAAPVETASSRTLALGMLSGLIFGFLLQKGGVAKFHVLIGQLLLVDYTVVKIMLSAVVVGMIGVHWMHSRGMVELHIKPTRLLSNALGGLIFGAGFGLAAYCPGTGAAALGQGNFDAIAMIIGMLIGSYLFALSSGWIGRKIDPVGDQGKLTLFDWFRLDRTVVIALSAIVLTLVLVVIEWLAPR